MSLKISSKEEFELMFKNYIAPLLGLSSNNSSFENVKCEHKLIKLSNHIFMNHLKVIDVLQFRYLRNFQKKI